MDMVAQRTLEEKRNPQEFHKNTLFLDPKNKTKMSIMQQDNDDTIDYIRKYRIYLRIIRFHV